MIKDIHYSFAKKLMLKLLIRYMSLDSGYPG